MEEGQQDDAAAGENGHEGDEIVESISSDRENDDASIDNVAQIVDNAAQIV